MDINRDMMQGCYFQGMPGNMAYGNFGFQGPPGSLMQNNMGYSNNMMPGNAMDNNSLLIDLSNRVNSLEKRVKILEQKLSDSSSNQYQDDGSMYMI